MNTHIRSTGKSILLWILIFATIITLIIAAVWFIDSRKYSSNTLPLVTISFVGGLCPEGECTTSYKLYLDGKFDKHKDVSKDEIEKLKTLIDASDMLKFTKKFAPKCPSFSDGADEILYFPRKYADASFRICELQGAEEDPLVQYIDSLLQSKQ